MRMLGTGRPFIFEFVNPRRAYSPIGEIEKCSVNSKSVKVKDFKIVDKEFFDRMKEIESQKAKRYSAVVWLSRDITEDDCKKLNSLRNIKLAQQTPIRVLHRRSQMVRDKEIYRV